jgi:hypothetical protein
LKPTLLSCFSTQFVVDEAGQVDHQAWIGITSNAAPLVVNARLLWVSWDNDQASPAYDAESGTKQGLHVLVRGPEAEGFHTFLGLPQLCRIERS